MVDINWLGHASFQIVTSNNIIYIDPYNIKEGLQAADIIIITHDHYDHLSIEDIEKISKPDTLFIGNKNVLDQIKGNKKEINVGDDPLHLDNLEIRPLPSYNTNKSFHPKENKNLGVLLIADETSIYHAGDTDVIPEMKDIQCDYALIPVSGTYVMDVDEACEAANLIDAKNYIPMHYGSIVGSSELGLEFLKNCTKHVIVKEILNP